MPRTLPAGIEAAILLNHTEPGWLVEMLLSSPLRYSTGGQVEWNGYVWLAGGIHVEFSQANLPTISLPNHNNAGSALMLNNILRDVVCNIYLWYSPDAELYFSGYLSPADTSYRFTRYTAETTRSDRQVAPRRRMVYPTFTRMPAPGKVIHSGNTFITVGY